MKLFPSFAFAAIALPAACAFAGGGDWMSRLDGGLSLSRLSIPGSHDSGALLEPLAGTAKCQTLTVARQLEAGVRFLDIRCRHQGDAFRIHHGAVDQKLTFAEVLDATCGFLTENPGETVIMSIKEEHTASGNSRSFEATFDSYVARNPSKWLLDASIPTLAKARGKIVLFRRFAAASTPKGIHAAPWPDRATFNSGDLRVQDEYVVTDPDKKWARILALLEEARGGDPDTLYLNFASGYVPGLFGMPDIPAVSGSIHPRLDGFFAARPRGRFGVVVMDFVDADRCEAIYRTNPARAGNR